MCEKETRELIEQTVNTTVAKLKAAGLLRDDTRSTREKTEELLRQYPFFKLIKGKKRTEKLVAAVDDALASIAGDPYCDIIRLYYFENQSRERIAERLSISPTTVSRNKARLVGMIAPRIFSDETITELFFE